jgi:hypothetical protein
LAIVDGVVQETTLIIEIPRGGAVERQLRGKDAPQPVASGEVVVEIGPTDADGNLEPSTIGQVVLSVPSPETLKREAIEVSRVIRQAGRGVEPIVVVVEAAEELREDELAAVLDAARHSSRPVIVRVIRNG